jgi:hypothetical protein
MMLIHLDESRLMHGTCWLRLLVQVVWCRLIGIGCYRLLVQVDSGRLIVVVVDSVTVMLGGCSLILVVDIQLGSWSFPQVVA